MKRNSKKHFPSEGLQVLAALFFKMIDEANDETIDKAVPWLARVLQEFDHVLGFGEPAASPFAAAVDARISYVLLNGLPKQSKTDRMRFINDLAKEGMMRDQLDAIFEAALQLKKKGPLRIRPCALMPIYRLQPQYQSKEALAQSGVLSKAREEEAKLLSQ